MQQDQLEKVELPVSQHALHSPSQAERQSLRVIEARQTFALPTASALNGGVTHQQGQELLRAARYGAAVQAFPDQLHSMVGSQEPRQQTCWC